MESYFPQLYLRNLFISNLPLPSYCILHLHLVSLNTFIYFFSLIFYPLLLFILFMRIPNIKIIYIK